MKDLIVFDMDGVLVEVTASYRATIQATVKHFTGTEPTGAEIQEWKNRGGWNDDWLLSTAMVKDRGGNASYHEVVEYFQELFLGANNDGLILKEEWVASDGLFGRLAERNTLAVFTGRLREEAYLTLNRFLPDVFAPVVGVDDVAKPKPDPEGLIKICQETPHVKCWYVGDTVDDARASLAAQVPFIGIAAKDNPRHEELAGLLRDAGAIAVLDDINSLEAVIAGS